MANSIIMRYTKTQANKFRIIHIVATIVIVLGAIVEIGHLSDSNLIRPIIMLTFIGDFGVLLYENHLLKNELKKEN